MKDFWKEQIEKKLDKKRIIILSSIIVLAIILCIIIALYINNESARNWIDRNILRKEISQKNLLNIELEDMEDINIYAFNRYIGILDKNNFDIYNNSGKKETTVTLEISKPIFNTEGRYLVVAQEKGQRLYVLENKNIIWEADVEGNISQVNINRNGYVAVTIVDTSYKTVVAMYDNKGEPLFKTFSSSTRVVSTSVSNDNKYLALAEVDTSGTLIQSSIKIISIEDGKNKNNAENSVKNIYEGKENDLITHIKYQEKNKLICMYSNKLVSISEDGKQETLQEYKDKKISFVSIDFTNSTIAIEEKSTGLFTADSIVNIMNSDNKSVSLYTAKAVTKEIYTRDNIIVLNLGSQVEFVDTNGWLIKRYTADKEVTSIVVSNSIAGIIYRDRIEIINL